MPAASTPTRTVERILAVLAVFMCTLAGVLAQSLLSALPSLTTAYLSEAVVASVVCGACLWKSGDSGGSLLAVGAWTAVGVLSGFTVMGLWSVGALFMPADVLLIAAAALATRRTHASWLASLGVFALAAIAQAGLMLIVVRVVAGIRPY